MGSKSAISVLYLYCISSLLSGPNESEELRVQVVSMAIRTTTTAVYSTYE